MELIYLYRRIIGIQGGPKRMQRFWSVISTTFLIECHWCLLYWIEYSFPSNLTPSLSRLWIRRFDSRAIFPRQCHFQNVLLFPRKQAWSSGNFSSDGVPLNQLCWQKHNCPHFEKEDNMNETEAFITQLCGTIIGIVPQSCVMNASVSLTVSSFSKWGNYAFVNTMGRRQMKNSRCFKPCLREEK